MPKLRLLWPLLLILPAAFAQAQSRTTYCCSAGGQRVCGDTLPAACYDRAYNEISGSGRVLREVEAPLTPEQRARKDAELRVQRERLAREAEARRRDQVLLESYATVGELERRRDRDLGNVESEIRSARAREADLVAQRSALQKRVPAKGNAPRALSEDLATNASEIEAIRSVIASKQRELDALRIRFDADRQRYLELSSGPAR